MNREGDVNARPHADAGTSTTARPTAYRVLAAVLVAGLGVGGCAGFDGVSDLPLPGGADLGDAPFHVTARFDDVLDLVPQAAVKVNDVAVGRVESIELAEMDTWQAEVVLAVHGDVDLPADTVATIRQSSLLGEKFVELASDLVAFTESVPTDSLTTVVDELHTAFSGAGDDLRLLLDSAHSVVRTAIRHQPQTTALLDDGATVLRTQADSAGAWRSFARDAALFAEELASSDGDLRELIARAPGAATRISELVRDTDPELSMLLANLPHGSSSLMWTVWSTCSPCCRRRRPPPPPRSTATGSRSR